ncbi:MAG: penicillin acylase family protein [Janthinobacterium lividum]
MWALPVVFMASAMAQSVDKSRWQAEASATTIVRDDWGIAHVHGKTDADAVFGMVYAQCEDDFNRVETNYLVSLGRLAEAEGEKAIWQDLRQRLFIDPEELKADYAASPDWLKHLMNAWADGLNFYLAQHPEVKPRVITHFEPWMALSFTEGSIGGDIEKVNLAALAKHYDIAPAVSSLSSPVSKSAPFELASLRNVEGEPGGSNGFAIAPSNTRHHHALLLINPHTSFFFRSELQMTSDEGLNAYGAVTWGQIFVYQGFNDRAGWMHTSSNVDAVDEYLETVTSSPDGFTYKYGSEQRPFQTKKVTLRYKTPQGISERTFTTYYNHRGPVIRDEGSQWVTLRLMNTPVPALEQSFLRTKAQTYAAYQQTMQLKANSSNNTVFADASGDIAYWHGDYIPKRDTRFDYTKPVDGSDPATDWQGLMELNAIPHLLNPKSGWLENVNNWPWSGAGESSLKRADFPAYVEQGTETARGVHAVRVLEDRRDFTLDSLMTTAYDSYLPWFARTIPVLVKAWDALPENSPQRLQLAGQIAVLRSWDTRWSVDSVPTSLAVYWGEAVGLPVAAEARRSGVLWEDYVAAHVSGATMLDALAIASDKLTADFGTWKTPWGNINRFQRLTDDIAPAFHDAAPSIPIAFTSSQWGSLASFAARSYPGTKRRYGSSGNSFVAVVEFGDKVRAKAVTAGGESGHPGSKHFDDEAGRYASGQLREVYFYPEQLHGHTERTYHPGD